MIRLGRVLSQPTRFGHSVLVVVSTDVTGFVGCGSKACSSLLLHGASCSSARHTGPVLNIPCTLTSYQRNIVLLSPVGVSQEIWRLAYQEALTPPHIMPMLEVWLTSQVASFGGDAGHIQPLPPPTAPAPLPSGVPSNPVPSSFLTSLTEIPASSRSPFAAQHSAPPLRGAAVSNPLSRQLHPAARAPDTAWSTS